jgi:protein involved in polysaccharide export with SLBB domain
MRRIFTCLLFFLALTMISNRAFSQEAGLSGTDLSTINIDNYTDAQLQSFLLKLEKQGYTVDQAVSMASAKGLPQTEIAKLQKRIEKIKKTSGTKTDSEKFKNKERNYTDPDEVKSDENKEKTEKEDDLFSIFKSDKKERPEDKIFGFSLFNRKKLTFEPNLNIATPQNYQLGANDEIKIEIWGASQQTYEQKISPEGTIFIDNVGVISLSGLTVEDATLKLRRTLTKIYAGLSTGGTFLKLSLGNNIRSIKVNIVGDVYIPGTYTLPSLASAFNALYAAGGPSINGTLRNVKIIRNNKVSATLDFYEFLLNGELKNNIQLQDQDIVFVSSYKNRVEMKGEIKRPLFFDVLEKESLKDLIRFSGGFTGKAYDKRFKIIRKTGFAHKILDVDLKSADTLHLLNGDEVMVDSVLNRFENRVVLNGAVYKPGNYSIDSVLTLKQLIQKSGGIRGDAFLSRAAIYRSRPDYTLEVIPIDLNTIFSGSNDIQLQREDVVFISSIFDQKEEYHITIEGEVRQPGEYLYVSNATVEDLILLAGGLKESASLARIEIARRIKNPNAVTTSNQVAEVFQFSISEDLKISNSAKLFELQPFDQVYVRRSPGYQFQANIILEGEVLFPGKYSISNKNERISDIIKRSGGLTLEAFPKGARLVRKLPIDAKARQKALETIKSQSRDSIKFIVEIDSLSTIGINLDRILANPGSKYDLLLNEGDVIKVPKELQTVRLSGQVLSPVLVRYDQGKGFKGYVSGAGGFAPDAKKSKSYIIYANGTMDRTKKIFFFNSYPKVEPGAEIVVPKKAERKGMSTGEAVSIATAVSSMALIIVTIIKL